MVTPSPLGPYETGRAVLIAGVRLIDALVELRRSRRADPHFDVPNAFLAWTTQRAAFWKAALHADAEGVRVPLVELSRAFDLSDAEVDLALLVMAPAVDSEFLDRLGRAHETLFFRGIDRDLALSLRFPTVEDQLEGRDLLSPRAALVRQGLIDPVPIDSRLNPHEVELRPSEALVGFLLERPDVGGTLGQYAELISPKTPWDALVLDDTIKNGVWELVAGDAAMREAVAASPVGALFTANPGLTMLFSGPPGTGKTALAHAAAHRADRPLLVLRTSQLAQASEPIAPLLRDALRVAKLHDALVLLDECEILLRDRDRHFLAALEALDANEGLLVLTTNRPSELDHAVLRRIQTRVDFERPDAAAREQIWRVHLGEGIPTAEDAAPGRLASAYELSGGAIRNAVLVALTRLHARGGKVLTQADLESAAESQLAGRLGELAVRGGAQGGLEQLVLPDAEREQLQEVLGACRVHDDVMAGWGFGKRLSTGRGICVLFDGPPGTGKTFAAELIAGELNLPLYRVHIPNVVSKWVGETERNLSEIFARARTSRAVLLFDEADSLFGKRAETKSATDRYANMEVNLLLQEIERYDGLTLLTTNLHANLDEALQRRIQFRIQFPFPEASERERIWRAMVPAETPLAADVDFEELAYDFELAGGHIKNALLRAAYRARAHDAHISHEHLVDSAIAECEAQGKLVQRRSEY